MTIESTLWTEKYRPESLDEIIGHEDNINRLKKYAQDDETPHMIFAGPPGTGKTASIVAFAREVYGPAWSNNLTEMNASDERGIDVIRDKVKGIARSSPAGDAEYQILFLDEADQLTKDAQASLRRIMEEHSGVTRFFLSCNYPNQIIEAIQSRCSMFRFGRLNEDAVREIIDHVAEEEGLTVEDSAIDKLVAESRGDARTAINSLQSSNIDGEVTEDSIKSVVGIVDNDLIERIVDTAIEGDTDMAMTILDTELLKKGANTNTMSDAFLRVIKRKDMPAPGRRKILDKLAEVDWRVRQGANPNVQWHSFIQDINVGYHLTMGEYDNGGD